MSYWKTCNRLHNIFSSNVFPDFLILLYILLPKVVFDYQTDTSTKASITTGRPNGKASTPTAERACMPSSGPYNVKIRSEKPLITSVV